MSEIARIAQLLEQTFEGTPYYGRSVLGALEPVTADMPPENPHGVRTAFGNWWHT
jgi:hypothetical protein